MENEQLIRTHRELLVKPEDPIIDRLTKEFSCFIPYGMPEGKREKIDDDNRTASAVHPYVLQFYDYPNSMRELHENEGEMCQRLLTTLENMLESAGPMETEQGRFLAKQLFRRMIDSRRYLVDFRKLLQERNIAYYKDIPHDGKSIQIDTEHKKDLEEAMKALFEEYEDQEAEQLLLGFSYNPDHVANMIDNIARAGDHSEIQSEFAIHTDFGFNSKGNISFRKDGLAASLDLSFLEKFSPNYKLSGFPDQEALGEFRKRFFLNSRHHDVMRENGFVTPKGEFKNKTMEEYAISVHTPYAAVVDSLDPTAPKDKAAAAIRGIGGRYLQPREIEDIHEDLLKHIQFDKDNGISAKLSVSSDRATEGKAMVLQITAPEGQYNVIIKEGSLVITHDYSKAIVSDEESYLSTMTGLNRLSEIVAQVNRYLDIQPEPSDLVVSDSKYMVDRSDSLARDVFERVMQPKTEAEADLSKKTLAELLAISSDSARVRALGKIVSEYGLTENSVPPELIQPINSRFGLIVSRDGRLFPAATVELIRNLHKNDQLLSPIEVPTIPVRRVKALSSSLFSEKERQEFNVLLETARAEMAQFRAKKAKEYLLLMGDEAVNFIRTFTDEQLEVMFPHVFGKDFNLVDKQGEYMTPRQTVEDLLRSWNSLNQESREALLTSVEKLRVDIDLNERFIGRGYVSDEYNYLGTTSWFDLVDRMDNIVGQKRLAGSSTLVDLNSTIGKIIERFHEYKEVDMTVADKIFANFLHNIHPSIQTETSSTGKTYLEALIALKSKDPKSWEQVKQLARARLFLQQFILGKVASQNAKMVTPLYESLSPQAHDDIELQLQAVHSPLLFAQHALNRADRPIPYGIPKATSLKLKKDRCAFISAPNMAGKSQIVMTCLAALSGAPLPGEREGAVLKVKMKEGLENKSHSFITSRDDDPTLSTFQNEAKRLLEVLAVQWGFLDESGGGATYIMQEALQDTLALLDGSVVSVIHDALPKAETMKTLLGEEFERDTAWYVVNRERQLVPNRIAAASGGAEATKRAVMPADYEMFLWENAKKAGINLKDVEAYQAMAQYLERFAEKEVQFITDADLDKLGYADSYENGKRSEVKELLIGLLEEKTKRLDLKKATYEHTTRSSAIATNIMEMVLKPSIAACMADDQRGLAREKLTQEFMRMMPAVDMRSVISGLGLDTASVLTHNLSTLMTLAHIMSEDYTLIPLLQDLAAKKLDINGVARTAAFLQGQEFLVAEGSQGTRNFLSRTNTIMMNLQNLLTQNADDVVAGEIREELRNNLAKKALEVIKRASTEVSLEDDRKKVESQIGSVKRQLDEVKDRLEQDSYKEFLDQFFTGFDESERGDLEAIFQRVKQLAFPTSRKRPEENLENCLRNIIDQKPDWYIYTAHLDPRDKSNRELFDIFYQAIKRNTAPQALSAAVVERDTNDFLWYIDRDLAGSPDRRAVRGMTFPMLESDERIRDLLSRLPDDKKAKLVSRMAAIYINKQSDFNTSASTLNDIHGWYRYRKELSDFKKYLESTPTPAERRKQIEEEVTSLNAELRTLQARLGGIEAMAREYREIGEIPEVGWIMTAWTRLEKDTKIPETRKREARIFVDILSSNNILESVARTLSNDLAKESITPPTLSGLSKIHEFVDIHDRLSYFGKDLNQILMDAITKPSLKTELSRAESETARNDLIQTMTVFAFSRLFHTLGQDAYCRVEGNSTFEFTDGINLQTVGQLGNRWKIQQMKQMEKAKTQVRVITASEIIREGKRRFRRMSLTADNSINALTGRNGGGKSTVVKGAIGSFVPVKIIGLAPAKRFIFPQKLEKARLIESRLTGIDLSAHMGGIVEIRDAVYGAGENTLLFCDETNKGTSHREELVENRTFLEYCLKRGIKVIFINHDQGLVEGIQSAHPDQVSIYGIRTRYKVDKTNVYVPPGSIDELRNMGWLPKTLNLVQKISDLIEKREKVGG